MSSKFLRNYKITLQSNSDNQQIIIEPPFTVMFNVQRGTASSLNSMQLYIYNLSLKNRNQIFMDWFDPNKYKGIIFQAGYDGQLSTIFKGNIKKADSYRNGADIITFIDAIDGGFAQENTLAANTLKENTSIKDVLNNLISGMSNVSKGVVGNIDGEVTRPVVLEGNSYELLQKYSNDQAFIDLEKVYVLKNNECLKGDVSVLTSETGLIGTPRRNDAFIQVETLFEPKIFLAQIVSIKSDIQPQYNGQYKVMGINHSGTISEAIGGDCVTKLNLLIGTSKIGALTVVG